MIFSGPPRIEAAAAALAVDFTPRDKRHATHSPIKFASEHTFTKYFCVVPPIRNALERRSNVLAGRSMPGIARRHQMRHRHNTLCNATVSATLFAMQSLAMQRQSLAMQRQSIRKELSHIRHKLPPTPPISPIRLKKKRAKLENQRLAIRKELKVLTDSLPPPSTRPRTAASQSCQQRCFNLSMPPPSTRPQTATPQPRQQRCLNVSMPPPSARPQTASFHSMRRQKLRSSLRRSIPPTQRIKRSTHLSRTRKDHAGLDPMQDFRPSVRYARQGVNATLPVQYRPSGKFRQDEPILAWDPTRHVNTKNVFRVHDPHNGVFTLLKF